MSSFKNSQPKRFAAGIIALMMLIVVLFAVSFITEEADHDCSGDDCPICACIQLCENTIQQIGSGAAAQAAVIIPAILFFISILLSVCVWSQETLVSRKARLNN